MLDQVPGISFPIVRDDDRSTYKDLVVLVHAPKFGLSADELREALAAEGIETRRYYSPPVHLMRAYRLMAKGVDLPVSVAAAHAALALPLWPDMTEEHIDKMADTIIRLHAYQFGR
jgi:dTDP-4-amino-4,6-dideoxygalactose transaminase